MMTRPAPVMDAKEAARRFAAAMAEAGFPIAVRPTRNEPDFPWYVRDFTGDRDLRIATWRAFFLVGRRSLPCLDCYLAHYDEVVRFHGCEHDVVWA